MSIIRTISFGLLILSFFSCSTGYKNEGDAVYYEHWNEGSGQHKERIDADPRTFKILKFDAYAKDDNSVFFEGKKIVGADAKTFEALGDFYARDKNFGWYGNDTIQTSNGATFTIISDYYSTDGIDVFYRTDPLKITDPKKLNFVYGKGDDDSWATDGKYYYYRNYKIPSDDYEHLTFYPKSGGISNDRHWAYFLDHKLNYDIDGKRVIDTIDIASFKVTGFIKCRDKYGCFNVYHGRDKCDD